MLDGKKGEDEKVRWGRGEEEKEGHLPAAPLPTALIASSLMKN